MSNDTNSDTLEQRVNAIELWKDITSRDVAELKNGMTRMEGLIENLRDETRTSNKIILDDQSRMFVAIDKQTTMILDAIKGTKQDVEEIRNKAFSSVPSTATACIAALCSLVAGLISIIITHLYH